ncbi:MAG: PepSY-associated TM helix domain-containing protein [Pseudomonadota bacterium]
MAWLHTWSGLVLSLFLYFIFITGSIGYFNYEVDHWMTPEAPAHRLQASTEAMLTLGIDYLQEAAPAARRYFVSLPLERGNPTIRVFATLKQPNEQGDTSIERYLHPLTGAPVPLRDTGGGNALYRMHYALHYIPYDVAIYIVGIATLFMLLALLTGIVTHKKIFKDFFTLRLGKGQRSWLDAHNISSVLALPFLLMITYSGLVFYDLEYSPGTLFLTMGVDDAAINEMFAHLRPGVQRPVETGVQVAGVSLAEPISAAQQRWGEGAVRYLEIVHPGDGAALIRMGNKAQGIGRVGEVLSFNGVSGEMQPLAPAKPADAVFAGSVLALHEGRFASYWLRWAYFLSGLLGAGMIATGLLLWAKKRRAGRADNVPVEGSLVFIERTNLAIIVGLPLGIAAYFWANRLLPLSMGHRAEWELHVLFITWALSFAHAGARELRRAWREQVALLAALFLMLPLLNAFTTDVHLTHALATGDWTRAGFDITSLVAGLLLCLVWRVLPQPATPPVGRDLPDLDTTPGAAPLTGTKT